MTGCPKAAQRRASLALEAAPRAVALRVLAAIAAGAPPPRGVIGRLNAFYARLADQRRLPSEAREEDFAAVAPTRTKLYQLLHGLERFAPETPLGPARALRRDHDRALNARYPKKRRPPRARPRVAVARPEWPAAWREAWRRLATPTLDERLRLPPRMRKPLAAATLAATADSVGLFLAARVWAAERGVELPLALDHRSAEGFARYLRNARGCSERSVVAHLERLRRFGRRGLGLDCASLAPFTALVGAWEARARLAPKRKTAMMERFYERHSLSDIPRRAAELARAAADMPGHQRKAERLRLKAAILALTVNAPERLADLAALRFGPDGLSRHPDGRWSLRVVQNKTARRKENPALWQETGAILDTLILGDRPQWLAQERYAELVGDFVLSLRPAPAHREFASVLYHEEFGIRAHAIRTLVVDFFKQEDPENAAACRALLGHRDPRMHEEYRTEMRDAAAMRRYRATLESQRRDGARKTGRG